MFRSIPATDSIGFRVVDKLKAALDRVTDEDREAQVRNCHANPTRTKALRKTRPKRRLTLATESSAELLSDLAFCLASSGDREALAALVETQLRARRFVSGLREVIEGYPYEGQYAFSTQKSEVEAEVERWWRLMEFNFDPEFRLWRARLR